MSRHHEESRRKWARGFTHADHPAITKM
jgi:hypothetical protein